MGSATMDRLLRAEKATGDHCYTLTVTDRRPWWTAIVPVPSRAQVYVFAALTTVLSHLPFPVLVLHAEGNLFTDAPYYKTIRYDVSSLIEPHCWTGTLRSRSFRRLSGTLPHASCGV